MALPYLGILLAFQAAGTIIDYRNTRNQQKLIRQGRQLEQQAFENNLETIRLQSEQESVDSMVQLRKNLGSQIASNAAKGTLSGQGSALTKANTSIGSYNSDERTRRMNLLSKEANLRANNIISGLHTTASETQLGQAMAGRFINSLPVSTALGSLGTSKLAKDWGFGMEASE